MTTKAPHRTKHRKQPTLVLLKDSPSVRRQVESIHAHQALATGLKIIVSSMGPRQREAVARKLAAEAEKTAGPSQRILLRLALFVR